MGGPAHGDGGAVFVACNGELALLSELAPLLCEDEANEIWTVCCCPDC